MLRSNQTTTKTRDKNTTNKPNTDRTKTRRHRTGKRATTTRKKTCAGRGRGVGVEHEVRVEGGVRLQDEETQGEPQTPEPQGGFGFPQRLRERESKERKKNTASTDTPNKEQGGTQTIKPNTGRALKGSTYRITHRPLRKTKRDIYTDNDRKNQKHKLAQTLTNSQGNVHRRVEGPMGRPPFSWRVTPQGTVVPTCPKTPPTTGTAPSGAITAQRAGQITETPRGWVRLLAGPVEQT